MWFARVPGAVDRDPHKSHASPCMRREAIQSLRAQAVSAAQLLTVGLWMLTVVCASSFRLAERTPGKGSYLSAGAVGREKRTRSAAVHRLRGGEGPGVRIPVAIAPSSQHRANCGRLCAFSSAEPGPPGTQPRWRQRVAREAPSSARLSRISGLRASRSPSYKWSMTVHSPHGGIELPLTFRTSAGMTL